MRCLLLGWLIIIFSQSTLAKEPVIVTGMLIKPGNEITQVTFNLSAKTFGRVKYIPNPNRVVVEFENTQKHFVISNAKLIGGNVTSIDSKEINHGVTQFIFYVTGNVHATAHFLPNDKDNRVRLRIDIVSTPAAPTPKPTKKISNKESTKPLAAITLSQKITEELKQAALTKIQPAEKKSRLFTVVIDAGHGGKDPGALGAHGHKEKEIVLAIAKKLAAIITRQPNMRVVLTRNGDYFVPLVERLKRTRKGEADLFLSIHADAYFDKTATGASVYTLSKHGASSVAARWLATRENHSELDGVELNALNDQSRMLRSVLIDLAQTTTARDSLNLGSSLLDALEGVSTLHYSHVEHAPFLVLKSPDIPSVLIETGFITNKKEELRLADATYQEKVAQAIWIGVHQYIKKYGS